MSTNETQTTAAASGGAGQPPIAKEAPTEQQKSQPGVPKRFFEGQTVCNEKNEKGKLCNGHLKQVSPIREESRQHMRGDDLLYKCQTCGTLYAGPPLGHVRDPGQRRYVMSEQNAILVAAGGTLPAFRRTETGALVLATEAAPAHAPAKPAVTATAKPAPTPAAKPATAPPAVAVSEPDDETPEQKRARKIAEAAARRATAVPIPGASGPPPEGETPEQKIARLKAVVAEAKRRKEAAEAAGDGETPAAPLRTTPTAATTAGTDSSPAADAHRPAAEAQAATGQASAVPLSAATATASPAAGAETVADLATEASTELTPGAPKGEAAPKAAARRAAPTPPDDRGMPLPPPHLAPPVGETHEEKIARLQAVVTEAKRRAGKE